MERIQHAMKVKSGDWFAVDLQPATGLDEHGGDAQGLNAIAEGSRLMGIVVSRDHAFRKGPHGLDETGTHLLRRSHGRRHLAGRIGRRREHRNGRRPRRAANARASILIVQVESELRLQ